MEEKKEKRKRLTPEGYEWKCDTCEEWIPIWAYLKGEYVYKIYDGTRIHYFCSWHCMREYERTHKKGKYTSTKSIKKYRYRDYDD